MACDVGGESVYQETIDFFHLYPPVLNGEIS